MAESDESSSGSNASPFDQDRASEDDTGRRFLAVTLPSLSLDEVWTRHLEEMFGCGEQSEVVFNNRRGTGGNLHYATITYHDAEVAAQVAARPQTASFGGLVPTVALTSSPTAPTHVEVRNLVLPPAEILKQFQGIGPIMSHRLAQRQQKAEFIYADRGSAERAKSYDGKSFKGQTVSVTFPGDTAAAGQPEPRVLKRKRAEADLEGVGKLSRHIPRKRLLKAATPPETMTKVVALRKKKEQVMEKIKIVKKEQAKVAKQRAAGETVVCLPVWCPFLVPLYPGVR